MKINISGTVAVRRQRMESFAAQTAIRGAILALAVGSVFAGCGVGVASKLGGCSPAPCGGTSRILGYVTGLQRVAGGVEISVRIENRFTQPAYFVLGPDFAVLTDAGERFELAPSLDSACFQSMDPDVQIDPHHTVDVRKPICFAVPQGVTPAAGSEAASDTPPFTVQNASGFDAGQAQYTFEVSTAGKGRAVVQGTGPAGSGTTSFTPPGPLPRASQLVWTATARSPVGLSATSARVPRRFRRCCAL